MCADRCTGEMISTVGAWLPGGAVIVVVVAVAGGAAVVVGATVDVVDVDDVDEGEVVDVVVEG